MIIRIKKIFYQFFYALYVFWHSKKIWPIKFWANFWITNETFKKIQIHNFTFFVRGKNLFDKLIDMYAVLENVLFSPYIKKKVSIPKDATIIDIGGHIGSFCVYAASIFPNGKIYSFEPFPPSFALASKNIEANGLINAKIFNLAVSSKNGFKNLYLNSTNNSGHSFVNLSPQSVEVSSTTLKNIFEENKIENCDLLKLDCEGGEYDILLNAEKDVLDRVRQISMEYHLPEFFGAGERNIFSNLIDHLKKHGFEVVVEKENYQRGYLYAKNINISEFQLV